MANIQGLWDRIQIYFSFPFKTCSTWATSLLFNFSSVKIKFLLGPSYFPVWAFVYAVFSFCLLCLRTSCYPQGWLQHYFREEALLNCLPHLSTPPY